MFDFIRNHRRWMQFILLLLIVPSFVFVGVQGYSSFMSRDAELAEVGGEPISRQEFDAAYRNQIEQYRSLLGASFDPALVDTPEMRRQLLDQLIDRRVMARAAADGRFNVSDETLRRTIAAIPAVQENGQFSAERYRQALAAQGLTPVMFEQGLRRDLAVARVLEPVGNSAYLPDTVGQRIQAALSQARTVRLRTFSAADYRDGVQVSDADVQAWYDANQDALRVPQYVTAEYLVLDEAAAGKDVKVSDQDIAGYYEQNKARFGQPERRRASHILVEAPAGDEKARQQAFEKAESLAKQAQANPDGFAELARQHSQDGGSAAEGGDLGWIPRGTLVEPVEQAIYSLGQGQVSGVVESPYGFHIIRVTQVEPERVRPLEQVRDEIVAEIRKQQAAARFSELASRLTDLVYDQRDSLQPAVDALGLQLRRATGIARDRLLDAKQVGEGAAADSPDAAMLNDARVRQALFAADALNEKANTGVIELDPGTMVALRVADVHPAHVPPLAEVAQSIRERLVAQRAAEAARKAGEAFLEAARKAPQDEASQEGFTPAQTVSRQNPGQLERPLLEAVMRAPAQPLPAFVGVGAGENYVVARIDDVQPGKPADEAAQRALQTQLSSAWGQAEERAVMQMLRERYKARVLPDARQAIDGEAADDQG